MRIMPFATFSRAVLTSRVGSGCARSKILRTSNGQRFAAKCRALAGAACAALCTLVRAPDTLAQDGYQYPSKVNVSWNRLNNYDEVTQILKDLAAAYPDLLTLNSIGKSWQGRDMWEMTLNVGKTGKDTDKPAMYIDGN